MSGSVIQLNVNAVTIRLVLYRTALVQRGVMVTKIIWGKCKGREVRDSTKGDGNRELIDHIDTQRNYGATDD